VIRYVDVGGTTKIDDYLSNAPTDTPLREFGPVLNFVSAGVWWFRQDPLAFGLRTGLRSG